MRALFFSQQEKRGESVVKEKNSFYKLCNDEIFCRITGAGLLGFYRLHMLEVITVDFMIVPMVRDLIVLIGVLFLQVHNKKQLQVCTVNESCTL